MILTLSLLIVNISGILTILYIPNYSHEGIRKAGLNASLILFILTTCLLALFDKSTPWIQFSYFNFSLGLLGVDGVSLFFILLTGLLIPLCLLTG
jgi:NADH:ubiquinone oxidoreductase subunit 4 (subunit M)